MIEKIKLIIAIVWNFRKITSLLDWKNLPDVSDKEGVRKFILERLDDALAICQLLTPNWKLDDEIVLEIKKCFIDDYTFDPIYWAIRQACVPILNKTSKKVFLKRFYRDDYRAIEHSVNPVVVASIVSIFINVLRILQWANGGLKLDDEDDAETDEEEEESVDNRNNSIPSIDGEIFIP